MKAIRLLLAALAALVLTVGMTRAQEPPKPGPEHALLARMEGVWETKIKIYVRPNKPPVESEGLYTLKMEVGGLFLVGDIKSKMLDADFQARTITGYDTFKKQYTGTWVDSMSTALYTLEGSFDKTGTVYTEVMRGPDPGTGKPMRVRTVTEIGDKGTMLAKMYGARADGKEGLMMEISYTRKR
jgi:hypothetical protein